MKVAIFFTVFLAFAVAQLNVAGNATFNTDVRTYMTKEIEYKLRSTKRCDHLKIFYCKNAIFNAYASKPTANTTLTLAKCSKALRLDLNFTTCCFTCVADVGVVSTKPVNTTVGNTCTKEQFYKVPICGRNETSVKNEKTGCPSCRRTFDSDVCTPEKIKMCEVEKNNRRDCLPGERPVRDVSSCCLSCVERTPLCSPLQKLRCRVMYPKLPDCRKGERPMFNTSSCCVKCKFPRVNALAPDSNGKCTRKQVEDCKKTRSPCKTYENVNTYANNSCCRYCTEPDTDVCSRKDVLKCLKDAPDCADDEEAVDVDGECCKSCVERRPKPTKCGSCAKDEICTQDTQGSAFVCRRRRLFKLFLRFKCYGKNITKEQLRRFFINTVKRFCSNVQNAKLCIRFARRLHHILVTKDFICKPGKNNFTAPDYVEFELPAGPKSQSPRSEEDDLENAITESMKSDGIEDGEGAEIVDDNTQSGATGSSNSQSSSSKTTPSGSQSVPTTGAATAGNSSDVSRVVASLFVVAVALVFAF